tara:strand:- start:2110 stop:2700 length:591 start_codon:yes stop_codon:yes gene_type:complete
MPTETCQMLHTNILYMEYIEKYGFSPTLNELKVFHWHNDSPLMKPAMLNHPSTIWARQSFENLQWLFEHGLHLCEEYTRRYGKEHGSHIRIKNCYIYDDIVLQHKYPVKGLTPVTIAMFDKYRLDEKEYYNRNPNAKDWDFVIASYRHYYLEGKWEFATWKTQPPNWWPKDHYDNMMAKKVEAFNRTYNAKLEEEE